MSRLLAFVWTLFVVTTASASQCAPKVVWVSDPARPGETVLVFGDGFGRCGGILVTRVADAPPKTPNSAPPKLEKIYRLAPLQSTPRSVKFALPNNVPDGIFYAKLVTPMGNVTVQINRPAILWAQGDMGDKASPGGFVRLFGRCLRSNGRKPTICAMGAGAKLMLAPSLKEPFTLQAALPANIKPGTYHFYAHSGCGGTAGWSEPVVLTVSPRQPARNLQVDVTTTGADGSDEWRDDTAIESAIKQVASRGGGTVYLPRGRYIMKKGLVLPPGVKLQGEGTALTALCWSDADNPPEALIRGTHGFGVENLTIYATNHVHGIVADQNEPDAGNVRIRAVRMRLDPYRGHLTEEEVTKRFSKAMKLSTGGGDSLRLGGANVEVAGCDIYGGGRSLYLSRGKGVWIHDNTLYNGRWGWYCISGSNGVVFERNRLTGGDLMSTGGGLNCLDGSNVSQNVYYANNTLKNMFGWDREAMTSDAGGGAYYGKIRSVNATHVELAGEPTWNNRDWTGAAIFILDGKGQGQYRQIVKTVDLGLDVDSPWTIEPDETSVATITMLQRNYLLIGNTFEDAGVGIQLYGAAVGHICSGNTSIRTDGFHNFGMNYYGVQPSWYIQWLGNRISEGNVYGGGHDQSVSVGEAHLGVFAIPPGVIPDAPVTLCTIVRRNQLENNAHLAIGGSPEQSPGITYPYVQDVVVEENRVSNASAGLVLAHAASSVLCRNNSFKNCVRNVEDEIQLHAESDKPMKQLMVEQGPILRLTFGEQHEGTFKDVSGHGFDAMCSGSCRIEPGAPGGSALVLDGKSYATVDGSEIMNLPTFTLSVWVKADDWRGRWGILAKRYGGGAAPFILGEWEGRINFEATDDQGVWTPNYQSEPVLKPNVWQHIAAVRLPNHDTILYVDGVEVARKSNTRGVMSNHDPLCIGREAWGGNPPDTSGPCLLKARIADVTVWSRALDASAVAKLAEEGKAK